MTRSTFIFTLLMLAAILAGIVITTPCGCGASQSQPAIIVNVQKGALQAGSDTQPVVGPGAIPVNLTVNVYIDGKLWGQTRPASQP